MNRFKLSRRAFSGAGAALIASLIAACRGPESDPTPGTRRPEDLVTRTAQLPSPTSTATSAPLAQGATATAAATPAPTATPAPMQLRIWTDPAIPANWSDAAATIVDELQRLPLPGGARFSQIDDRAAADVRVAVASTASPDALIVATRSFLPVTSPRVPHRSVTGKQLDGLFDGSIGDWKLVGSPSSIALLPAVIGGVRPDRASSKAIELESYDQFVELLDEHPGALALAPLDLVDYRVQSLVVDGVELLTTGTPSPDARLNRYLVVEGSGQSWEALRSAAEIAPLTAAPASSEQPITVTMAGDIIFGRTVHTIMRDRGDFTLPLKLVADELKQADLTIANLECTLSDSITPPTDPRTFSFMSFTACVDGLVMCGINGVSQANNHSMNFGARGMRDTLAALDAKGIKHFGIGENLAESRQPRIFDVKGMRVAYLGYDGITGDTDGAGDQYPGTSPLDVEYVVEDIKALKGQADIIIPFIHWGVEYLLTPGSAQRAIARQAIDAGATMVVGSHPHWVQGMETYQGKPIVYSLGNFVFDQEWSRETKQGLIMHLVFRGTRLAGLRFVPVLIEDFHRPRIVEGAEKIEILDRVWESTDILRGRA